MTGLASTRSGQALSLRRIVAAVLLLQHATAKLFGIPPSAVAFPPAMSLLWVAGIMELIGGLLRGEICCGCHRSSTELRGAPLGR